MLENQEVTALMNSRREWAIRSPTQCAQLMKLDETWTTWKFLRRSVTNPLYKEMVLDRKH